MTGEYAKINSKTIQKRCKNEAKTKQKRSKNDEKTMQKRSKNDEKTKILHSLIKANFNNSVLKSWKFY